MRKKVTDADIEALDAGERLEALGGLPFGASEAERRRALEKYILEERREKSERLEPVHRRRAALSPAIYYYPDRVRDLTFSVSGLLAHLEYVLADKSAKREWDPTVEFGAYLGIGRQRASEVVQLVRATGYYTVEAVGRAGVEFARTKKADELKGLRVERVNRALYLQLGLTQAVLYQLIYARSRTDELFMPSPIVPEQEPALGFHFAPRRLVREMPWSTPQGVANALTSLKRLGLVERRKNAEGLLRYFVCERFLPLSADETAEIIFLQKKIH